MFSASDFIREDIQPNTMRFGWKVSAISSPLSPMLALDYTMLNFDWTSLQSLNGTEMNAFLASRPYARMRAKLDRAMKKFGRLRFEAYSISDLKMFVEQAGLKIDVDALMRKTVRRKSDRITEKLKNVPVKALRTVRRKRRRGDAV